MVPHCSAQFIDVSKSYADVSMYGFEAFPFIKSLPPKNAFCHLLIFSKSTFLKILKSGIPSEYHLNRLDPDQAGHFGA